MTWNYRGFGHTKGTPSPYNLQLDGESILHFLLNDLGLKGKIGVYGRSIGGIVACHLAAEFDNISLIVADRTFGSLNQVCLS